MRADDQVKELADALRAASSPQQVASALARNGAQVVGADFVNLGICDQSTNELLVRPSPCLDADAPGCWRRLELTEDTVLGYAILRAEPVLLGSPGAMAARFPQLKSDAALPRYAAAASLPLVSVNDVVLGAAAFAWTTPQAFDEVQFSRLRLMAQFAAYSLERVCSFVG